MTSKLNKEILDKINKEDLKPISKSYFSWKNRGFWFGLTITLVLIGIIFSFCVNDAFDVRETMMMGHNYGSFFFYVPVLFWITIIGLFIYLGIIEFRKTKYGYKTSLAILITYIVIISLVLGTVFIYYPYSRQIHRSMVDNMPFLTQYIYNESARDSPENGRLIGTIKEVDSEKIVLSDSNGKDWSIDKKEVFMGKNVELAVGEKIRVLGNLEADNTFKATKFMPYFGAGDCTCNHSDGMGCGMGKGGGFWRGR